eukprot:TRINITY_DN2139_c0_g1_i2.p1 TRINITY_DN2139_c0_g1~~TRINITY_DN2139_c0_g1_i2.p1  ORF type:complete len:164 (+),score=31.14 TRINITY_DN2139_c0_g1_i2:366-857(+)
MGGFVPTPVDAGFQYSADYDNWAGVINAKGHYSECSSCARIPGGTTVDFEFSVDGDSQTVTLSWNCDGCSGPNTVTSPQLTVDTSNCLVKRITSMAQSSENFSTGSNITNVQWSNCMLGQSSSTAQEWSADVVSAYINYPDENVIQVNFQDQSDETDYIFLDE